MRARSSAALLSAVVAVGLGVGAAPAAGPEREVHGEDAVFVASGLAVVWGVLRAPVEEQTEVVIRVAPVGATYAYVRVDAVDPFAPARRPVAPGRPLTGDIDIRGSRAAFGEFPRREIRLYATAEGWRDDRPALTIYYLGVPDTTPEFVSESALLGYLATTVAQARAPGGRRP